MDNVPNSARMLTMVLVTLILLGGLSMAYLVGRASMRERVDQVVNAARFKDYCSQPGVKSPMICNTDSGW